VSDEARHTVDAEGSGGVAGAPRDLREVKQRLSERRLTPTLERAARAMFEEPHDFAFLPLTAFADRAGIPPTSFVRLARAAGLEGYKDLKNAFRLSLREATRGRVDIASR
jgi:DNA-binding MurR/RpiR family transcriptional regulator